MTTNRFTRMGSILFRRRCRPVSPFDQMSHKTSLPLVLFLSVGFPAWRFTCFAAAPVYFSGIPDCQSTGAGSRSNTGIGRYTLAVTGLDSVLKSGDS